LGNFAAAKDLGACGIQILAALVSSKDPFQPWADEKDTAISMRSKNNEIIYLVRLTL
jgi:hypothetical protein